MMKIQSLSLAVLLILCANLVHADATDDLLLAIDNGDMDQVQKAIQSGADPDMAREEDGHNARSLSIAKLIDSLEKNQDQTKYLALTATSALPIAAAVNNWKYTLASSISMLIGYNLTAGESKGFIQKIRNTGIGKYIMAGSLLATMGIAWGSKNPYTLVSSALGTSALLGLIYKSRQIQRHFDIYSFLNPEDEFFVEEVQ